MHRLPRKVKRGASNKDELRLVVLAELSRLKEDRGGKTRHLHQVHIPTTPGGAEYVSELILILLSEGQDVWIRHVAR